MLLSASRFTRGRRKVARVTSCVHLVDRDLIRCFCFRADGRRHALCEVRWGARVAVPLLWFCDAGTTLPGRTIHARPCGCVVSGAALVAWSVCVTWCPCRWARPSSRLLPVGLSWRHTGAASADSGRPNPLAVDDPGPSFVASFSVRLSAAVFSSSASLWAAACHRPAFVLARHSTTRHWHGRPPAQGVHCFACFVCAGLGLVVYLTQLSSDTQATRRVGLSLVSVLCARCGRYLNVFAALCDGRQM